MSLLYEAILRRKLWILSNCNLPGAPLPGDTHIDDRSSVKPERIGYESQAPECAHCSGTCIQRALGPHLILLIGNSEDRVRDRCNL